MIVRGSSSWIPVDRLLVFGYLGVLLAAAGLASGARGSPIAVLITLSLLIGWAQFSSG